MSQFFAIPFSPSFLKEKKAINKLESIVCAMDKECNQGEEGHCYATNCLRSGKKDHTLGILFLLVEGNQLLSSAFLKDASQVTYRWTPPSQRKKGYGVQILKLIEEVWAVTETRPLWVCSWPYMAKLNERAEWVKFPFPNEFDESQDWFPPQYLDRYTSHWERQQAFRKKNPLADTNKHHTLYGKKESEGFMKDYFALIIKANKDFPMVGDMMGRVKKLKW